jgi:hypothetical protein
MLLLLLRLLLRLRLRLLQPGRVRVRVGTRLKRDTVRGHAVLPVRPRLEAALAQIDVPPVARAAVPPNGPRTDEVAAVRAEDAEGRGGRVQEVVQHHGLWCVLGGGGGGCLLVCCWVVGGLVVDWGGL